MRAKRILYVGLGILALGAAGFAGWMATLPAGAAATAPPVPADESAAALAQLKPAGPGRPVVAVIGINDATETTDYLVTLGILRRADVADVTALATGPGPVALYPALAVEPDETIAEFDARVPGGADYVIVPAMSRDDDPAALAWLRSQAAKGAHIIGVCAGATVVAEAWLLDGRRATTHWYYLEGMLEEHPDITYVPDRRYVVDGPITTTTGITASMPTMLTLIEAIAGRPRADSVALSLGLPAWDAHHPSAAFGLTRPFALTVTKNVLAFWNRDELGLELTPGMDEVSLALVADAWSRTYRSRALTFAQGNGPVETLGGLRIIPDHASDGWVPDQRLPPVAGLPPVLALDEALHAIEGRYGARTARVVAMQLEYPR